MSSTTPITQRDVAHACGVHPSTICLALNNSPSIPLLTRRRIQTTARELGYQPNAAARNLALMRTDKKSATCLPLAWINQEPARDYWRQSGEARRHYDGAARQAAELGYHLEEFWTHESCMSLARLAQIIRARGIECVLFPVDRTLDPALFQPVWNGFSCMAFNDHRAGDWFDVVCPDYYHNTTLALDRLHGQGYGRIGLVITETFDQASNGLVRSRFLRQQDELAMAKRIPACVLRTDEADNRNRLAAWNERYRPDAVLCRDLGPLAEVAGPDVNLVQLRVTDRATVSGVDELAAEVAATAVSCLADKVRRFEKGIGGNTRQHLIKGIWHETPMPAHAIKPRCVFEGLLAS